MASIQQIKKWQSEAIEIFTSYFPLDFLPEIHIANERNLIATRDNILIDLESETAHVDRHEYDSIMETIKGKYGWAILINQKDIPTPSQNPNADYYFYHFLWHELGHFLAIKSETTDLHRYNNPGLADDTHANRAKQEGYWFWSEFIAEAISNHVDVNWRQSREDAVYRPDLIEWEPRVWYPIAEKLEGYLEDVFSAYHLTVDEYILGIYFATLLKDDMCQLYQKAADECRLLTYDETNRWFCKTRKIEPGEIDATCIDTQDEEYQPILHEMLEMLKDKLSEEQFWIVDEDWIQKIGEKILALNDKKLALIYHANEEEATELSHINSMGSAEREQYLRETMGDAQYEAMMRFAASVSDEWK